jgi:Fe-S-cluster containining protein
MIIETKSLADTDVTCTNCEACCCRLEVMLITDTGVPDKFIKTDKWGGQTMNRLNDGWCSALDRYTMACTIYEKRPFICREFEMGSYECLTERTGDCSPPDACALGEASNFLGPR